LSLSRQLLVVLLVAVVVGAVASGFLTAAWVSENLSGDFADQETGAIDVGFTAATYLIWSAVFAASLAAIGAVAVFARRMSQRDRGEGGGQPMKIGFREGA